MPHDGESSSSDGSSSDSNSDSTQSEKYEERTSGTCTDGNAGWGDIMTKAACEKAAGVVGWSDVTANVGMYLRDMPPGCVMSHVWGQLYVNTYTRSTTSCNTKKFISDASMDSGEYKDTYKCLCIFDESSSSSSSSKLSDDDIYTQNHATADCSGEPWSHGGRVSSGYFSSSSSSSSPLFESATTHSPVILPPTSFPLFLLLLLFFSAPECHVCKMLSFFQWQGSIVLSG